MAQRRMMSLKVIDTDDFLDMPMSSQFLYFNLAMRADDDGFIANAKRIMRMVGCNDDDLKVLFAKMFVIPFESGVCVIKHWRIHNFIRKDRYTETIHQAEKNKLEITDGKYGKKEDVIPNGNLLDTQVRLGKVRLGKVNNKRKIKEKEIPDSVCLEISEKYNIGIDYVKAKREELELYCGSTGKRYSDYKLALMSWVRRDISSGKVKKLPKKKVYEDMGISDEQKAKNRKVIADVKQDLIDKNTLSFH